RPEVADSPSPARQVSEAAGTPEPDTLAPAVLAVATGEATYYADRFNGRRTASGVIFRNSEYFAAHRTWPFGTVVRVTRVSNGRSVIVTVVDRGPNGSRENQRRTIIDVSRRAAEELGFVSAGRTPVQVEVLHWGG
ncbi:MAG TPA: septal ring lytic transglycosylase RlpA family protein, partial [Longimicrobiales bacterium]|nr:septal ring lytic transglycosylase RlpA family protein [Longimicrobiales bacterium]